MSSKRITIVFGALLVGIFGIIGYQDAVRTWHDLQERETTIETLNIEYEQLNDELDTTKETQEQSQEEVEKLKQEKTDLELKREELEKELQAKKAEESRLAIASQNVINKATNTAVTSAASGPMTGCGDNQYAAFIYGVESGGRVTGNCNPAAVNPNGCLGIGQACPGSKLTAVCPNLDYACQNEFFTAYAVSRYGSWAGAYTAWHNQGWW